MKGPINMKDILDLFQYNGDDDLLHGHNKKPKSNNTPMVSLPVKVYFGYLNNKFFGRFQYKKPLVISMDKELVKRYMEDHRSLRPKQYIIKEESMTENELFLQYNDQCIVEYEGYYIPNIDANIIDFHKMAIDNEIINTINGMRKITLLSQNIKGVSKEDVGILIEGMKILTKFIRNNKIFEGLCHEDLIENSILYCSLEDYMYELRLFDELQEQHKLWEYQLFKDEDFPMLPGGKR
jgi:hypothetical protein